jgi:DNA-directed RNA polymerase specialized sigma24 family protein
MTATQFGMAYTEGFHRTVCFLSSKGLPDAEAEEIAQAAWTRGWERRHQLRDQAMVFTWVNSIAFNLFRNQFRRNARHTELPEMADELKAKEKAGGTARDRKRGPGQRQGDKR